MAVGLKEVSTWIEEQPLESGINSEAPSTRPGMIGQYDREICGTSHGGRPQDGVRFRIISKAQLIFYREAYGMNLF